MSLSPRRFSEFSVSFRHADESVTCAFVDATVTRTAGSREVRLTAHLSGRGEALVDQALAELRRMVLEDMLPEISPF